MFEPKNGKAMLSGLLFVSGNVRVGKVVREEHSYTFLNIFTKEGYVLIYLQKKVR
jgi:hypothetical protein